MLFEQQKKINSRLLCIKLCLTALNNLFEILYQEGETIPSDTGINCQCIASSGEILDKNIVLNSVFSGIHFS